MNNPKPMLTAKTGWLAIAVLAVILALLFWRSFLPDYVFFSNDGPLGVQNAAWLKMPSGITGMWDDLNYLGGTGGAYTPDITALLHTVLPPIGFSKFYAPIALFILGIGAWTFFRQLKLTPLACFLGALAAMLNSTFFATACWGVASQEIAAGMNFLAAALIVGCKDSGSNLVRFARVALAGLCVGMNVMEAADIGALYSIMMALFVLVYTVVETEGSVVSRLQHGVVRVALVAAFAGFIAWQTVSTLVGTQVQGIAGTSQDAETKSAHYDWATQWSLPKIETLGLAVPGLFGYKMDTPKDMQPSLTNAYLNGVYWGGMGRDPSIDRWFDSGSQGPQPGGFMRFTGGGNYCGILVLLIAGWAIAQAFRREHSLFPGKQKHMIRFWTVVLIGCLLLAWGRFSVFYQLFYQIPYVSTIRNPAKFLNFFSWALAVVFAYGVHGLSRRYLDFSAAKGTDLTAQFKNWWAKANPFDRRWTYATVGLFGASVLGWLIYAAQKPALIEYLHKVGFGGTDADQENTAAAIAAFSIGQYGWFLLFFAVAVALVLLLLSGYFNGARAKTGMILLSAFMLLDLGRANLPWIVDWDYKQKYEVGSLNPIVDFLKNKPYEHRVAYAVPLPLSTPPEWELFDELYKIEWMQHHFPYYNIQSLDIVQMPRMPEDMRQYEQGFQIQVRPAPGGGGYQVVPETFPQAVRRWELTNTRYLLGPAAWLDELNQQFDPEKHRFRLVQRFEVEPKPGIVQPRRLEELTAVPSDQGKYALIEFTGALPRAKVYGDWQVNTNDTQNLKLLADLKFDPANTVLVSTPEPGLPATATNADAGTVDFQSYQTKQIVLNADTTAPSVLLLNDKYDPMWHVTVDGKPAELLRCNFMMRGVYIPAAGKHTVNFHYDYPDNPLYITVAAIAVGLLLCGVIALGGRKDQTVVA